MTKNTKPIVISASMFEQRVKFTPEPEYVFTDLLRLNFQLEKYTISEYFECMECGKLHVYTAYKTDQHICNNCIKDLELRRCSHCGFYYSRGDYRRDNNGIEKWYCSICSSDIFRFCTFCNTHAKKAESIYYNDKWVCKTCKNTLKITECVRCGKKFLPSEMDAHGRYCLHCAVIMAKVRREKKVNRATYKPSEMVFMSTDQTDNEYLGIELEFQWLTSENQQKALEFLERFEDHYLKEDGSVPDGAEIVTFPATKTYHEMRFKTILKELNDYCISHDHGACGIHIHINRLAYGANKRTQQKNISKLLYLVQKFQIQLKKFSRREDVIKLSDGSQEMPYKPYRFCLFYTCLDYENRSITRNYQKAVYDNRVVVRRVQIGGEVHNEIDRTGRYRVLNFQNENTIEFRLLRGTLNYQTFCAGMELICLLSKIAKTTTEKDLLKFTWSDFVQKASEIPVLFGYMKKRNITTIEG